MLEGIGPQAGTTLCTNSLGQDLVRSMWADRKKKNLGQQIDKHTHLRWEALELAQTNL